MLNVEERYGPDHSKVAAKVMDGEAILINLANGLYFSVGGVGGFIWSLVEQQQSPSQIADRVAEHFGVDRQRALSDVESLLTRLAEEELVIPLGPDAPVSAVSLASPPAGAAYEPPVLKRFDDMADMFALDPPLPGLAQDH